MDLASLLAEEEDAPGRGGGASVQTDYSKYVGKPYAIEELRRAQSVSDVGREVSQLFHTYGLDVQRKKNLHLIDAGKTLVYAAGNAVVFENVESGAKRYLLGLDEGGVGCVTIHPSTRIFAVGGRGFQPKIYIYTYPDMKIVNTLTGGAERGYASLNFNLEGNKLASVAQAPDYMLTVWDWEEERIALHAKAFGQDVFDVKFSLDDDRRLVTSGTGHIRFWKMASTFTGLKLQGSIGKFGKIELSDIQAFVELPDGKVVSGTENGALLLWEGNFIKCRFVQPGGLPCHASEITYVELDRRERCVMTASDDGFLRWWDLGAIDSAEVDSDVTMDFELTPRGQYYLGDGGGVKTLVDGGVVGGARTLVIVDKKGRIETLKFDLQKPGEIGAPPSLLVDVVAAASVAPVLVVRGETHAGPITGLDASPLEMIAATCGVDGTVRAWDVASRRQLACKSYGGACSTLRWLPATLDSTCKHVLVGFADGVVRLLLMGEDDDSRVTFARKMVFKPHNDAVVDAAFNPEGTLLATAGRDGNVFFFNCQETNGPGGSYTPLRFLVINAASSQYGGKPIFATRLSWSSDGARLLCSCSDLVLREVDVSVLYQRLSLDVESYEMDFPTTEFAGRVQLLAASESRVVAGPGSPAPGGPQQEGNQDEASDESKEGGDVPAPLAASPSSPSRRPAAEEEVPSVPLKVAAAIYAEGRRERGIYAGATAGPRAHLFECVVGDEAPVGDLTLGVYSVEGKNAVKAPLPTSLGYSLSRKFLLVGTADGSVVARPAKSPEVFLRVSAHNGSVSFIAATFDDRFLLSAGVDGTLSVHRLLLDALTKAADDLYKDLDAGVFGGALIKPPPNKPTPEPAHLTSVSSTDAPPPELEPSKDTLPPAMPHVAPGDENLELPTGAYSIQDAKLKSEEDAKLVTADEVKARVRLVVRALQEDYQKVVQANLALPAAVRLPPQTMAIDGEFFDTLRRQGDDEVSEVHKEFAYEAERAARLREKIERRLMPDLFVEEITLRALSTSGKSRSLVKSVRTQGVSESVRAICEAVRERMKAEEIEADRLRTQEKIASGAGAQVTSLDDLVEEDRSITEAKGSHADSKHETFKATGSGPAARREARRQRKLKLREHLKEKPNENDDDVRDLAAITLAENTIGDCKLKSADDYVVPSGMRINVERKREQMALLEDSMVKLRQDFNERFLALRDLKCDMIVSIRGSNQRIRAIDAELCAAGEAPATVLWEPRFDVSEFPDDRDEVTEEELERYMRERAKAPWAKCAPVPHSSITNAKTKIFKSLAHIGEHITSMSELLERRRLGHTYAAAAEGSTDVVVPLSDPHTHLRDSPTEQAVLPQPYELAHNSILLLGFLGHDVKGKNLRHLHRTQAAVPALRHARQALEARMKVPGESPETLRAQAERRRVLDFERRSLLRKIDDNVAAFAEAVDDLRVERQQLTGDLKQAELKLLTYFQEYQQLINFEARDLALQQKQVKSMKESGDIRVQMSELSAKLDGKAEEMVHWVGKAASVAADFKALVPENHAYGEQLSKIFRKKIKRSQTGGGDEPEEAEEEGDDEEEEEEDDDAEDVCPIGCDPATYEGVLSLRERRLDVEEMTAEVQKASDDCKKALDRLRQRDKQVTKDVQQVEVEIRQFQKQKLTALNQIEIVVPLTLGQIFAFGQSGVLTGPEDKAQQAAAASGPTPEMSEADAEYLQSVGALRDSSARQLVSDMSPKTHVIINTNMILQLNDRIGALKLDTDGARTDFAELKKERVSLSRERDERKVYIEAAKDKCRDLQLLKLGRVIDLDDLEAQSDRSREQEAERVLQAQQETFAQTISRLEREGEELQERLAQTMGENTALLNHVADLTERKLLISRELNAPGSKVSSESADSSAAAREEEARVKAYVQLQAREIESLRTEISMLKRKTAAPILMAPPPAHYSQSMGEGGSILPPIPGSKKATR